VNEITDILPPSEAPAGLPSTTPPWWSSRYVQLSSLALGVLVLLALLLAWLGGYSYLPVSAIAQASAADKDTKTSLPKLERRLAALQPRGNYIIVDSPRNRLRLMRDDKVIREAIASVGTGAVLIDEKSGRKWVFETPRGIRTVLSKKKNPCWRRPDWDYVENGEPLPKRPGDRIDCAALGDYALYLGDGYMIHGTLYERSLGLSVTHGCVRLGAADLEEVFKATAVGTKVYLY
jgi:L,D-transpeptidase ErfK/SrfK